MTGTTGTKAMAPEEAIATVGELAGEASRRVALLAKEAGMVAQQWAALGRIGGQRADHAADLLSHLRPLLRDLARYASACQEQIEAMQADPFGRGE